MKRAYRFALPDVAPPDSTGLPPTSTPTNVWYLVGGYNYMVNGDFRNTNSTKSIYVAGAGDVSVFVTGSFTNTFKIIVEPGASLKLHVGGPETLLNIVETDGHAFSFQYYGLPGNSDVIGEGTELFVGTVYAPEAALTVGNGGNNPLDSVGASVAMSITLHGHFHFHYDENLKRIGPMR